MYANPALGLVAGLSIAQSKGLTGSDATKVAMLAAIADFPMGIVLASVIAGREADAAAAADAARGGATETGTTKPPTATPAPRPTPPAGTPAPTPAPGGEPTQDPVVVLGNEFAKLQTAASRLALHESQATIHTKLEQLVEEIREAREELDEQNTAALRRDHEAREELGESEATEEREEAAERQREGGKPAASRGS